MRLRRCRKASHWAGVMVRFAEVCADGSGKCGFGGMGSERGGLGSAQAAAIVAGTRTRTRAREGGLTGVRLSMSTGKWRHDEGGLCRQR